MPNTKPFSVIAAWKRRAQREEQWVTGGKRIIDYTRDDDPDISGIQNVVAIDNIPHDPASEIIDVFLIGANREGRHVLPRLREFPFTVDLNATIDSVTTTVTTTALGKANDWPNKAFALFDDGVNREIMQITAGGGTTTWTVRRGEHGTTAAGFASGTTIRRLYFSVPHREITLSGDAVKLGPPTIAVEAILNGFRFTITPPSDPGNRLKQYLIYRGIATAPTTLWKTPLANSDQTYDGEFFLGFGEDKTATWYFRAKSVTRFGLISDTYSNEVSLKVLTQPDDETTVDTPTAPVVTVAANGGSVASGFTFTVGVTFADATGTGGVTKTQIQAADPTATHDTGTGFSATVFDGDFTRPPLNADIRVSDSSAKVGGAYQFSARILNSIGNLWSAWSTPVTALTTVDDVDAGAPGPAQFFDVDDASGTDGFLGNTIFAGLQGPVTNNNTVWGYEIQAKVGSNFNADLADTLGLTAIDASGTGDITTGGTTITNVSLGAADHSNKIVYTYGSANTTTGEITEDQAAIIDSNTATTITLKSGYAWARTTVGVNFAISATWNNFAYKREVVTRGPLAGGAAAPGDGFFLTDQIPFSQAAYWRGRFMGRVGRGQWRYHDGSTGTTTRASATTFTPVKLTGSTAVVPNSITAAEVAVAVQAVASDFAATPDGTSPHRKFSWAAFTVRWSDGTTQAIDAGDSGLLASNTSYWAYVTVGSSTLSITSSVASAVGVDKIIIAVIRTAGVSTEFVSVIPRWGDGNAILGVGVLNVGQLSAITADVGELTAGIITGLTIRTASSGARIEESSANGFRAIDSAGNTRVRIPTTYSTVEWHDTSSKIGEIVGQSGGMILSPASNGVQGIQLGTNGLAWDDFFVWYTGDIEFKTSAGSVKWSLDQSGVQRIGSVSGPKFLAGTGSPEGSVTAPISSIYLRTDGGTSTSFYVKEAGSGNTGWVAK